VTVEWRKIKYVPYVQVNTMNVRVSTAYVQVCTAYVRIRSQKNTSCTRHVVERKKKMKETLLLTD
jgi:hypothetical protein